MTDLTAITTPYGLLDPETQEALKAHGGPYECYTLGSEGEWTLLNWQFNWFNGHVYRVKPAPPKPREWWITTYDGMAWDDEASAQMHNEGFHHLAAEIILVREVLP